MQIQKILQGHPVNPLEHRIVHKNGTIRWIRDTIICHYDEQQKLRTYDGLVEDITERKLFEQRFWRIVEAAPDAMLVADQDGKITIVNAQAERLFGFARHELLQQSVEMLMPESFHERHQVHRRHYMEAPNCV